jgi:hypothetical protein
MALKALEGTVALEVGISGLSHIPIGRRHEKGPGD